MMKKDWFQTIIKKECGTENPYIILKLYSDMIQMCNQSKEIKKEKISS